MTEKSLSKREEDENETLRYENEDKDGTQISQISQIYRKDEDENKNENQDENEDENENEI